MWKKWLCDKRFAVILTAAVVRMSLYGFQYFPLLDDYIQYGCYPNIEHPFQNVYMKLGLFATRPLAGIFDIYVWGRLWDSMWAALLLITILHAVSACFFIKTADNLGMPLGLMFAVIYVLSPINIEGAYWISASSRIIVPLFFASISFYFLSNKKYVFFALFQFLSLLFYEQAVVFSILVAFCISVKMRNKKGAVITVVHACFIGVYYLFFAKLGAFGYRASLQFFNMEAVKDAVVSWDIRWLLADFLSGIQVCGIWFVIAAVVVGLCFSADHSKGSGSMILLGTVIFIFTYLPVLVSENNPATLRNACIPLIGAAIIFDQLFAFTKQYKYIFTAFFAVCFIIMTAAELDFYRENYQADQQIIQYVAENMVMNRPNVIVGAKARNVKTNFDLHEHIKGVSSSDWALTGAVREYTKQYDLPYFLFDEANLADFHLISMEWCGKINGAR